MQSIIPIILHIYIDQLYFSLCLTFEGNINHFKGVYLLFYFIISTCIIYYLKLRVHAREQCRVCAGWGAFYGRISREESKRRNEVIIFSFGK